VRTVLAVKPVRVLLDKVWLVAKLCRTSKKYQRHLETSVVAESRVAEQNWEHAYKQRQPANFGLPNSVGIDVVMIEPYLRVASAVPAALSAYYDQVSTGKAKMEALSLQQQSSMKEIVSDGGWSTFCRCWAESRIICGSADSDLKLDWGTVELAEILPLRADDRPILAETELAPSAPRNERALMRPSAGPARDAETVEGHSAILLPHCDLGGKEARLPMDERNGQPRSQSSSRTACPEAKECLVAWRRERS
jgi:hypothetical protein